MLVARQKEQENIAEYILYMYQLEDVIRAFNFDLDALMNKYVLPQLPDRSFESQVRKWYEDIIKDMKREGIEQQGHLMRLREVLVELSYLHNTLIATVKDSKYKNLTDAAGPYIEEFATMSNLSDKNHIEIALHAMYTKLLLRLQKKEISSETEAAFDSMRIMLAYLSRAYHKMKSGDLDFLSN